MKLKNNNSNDCCKGKRISELEEKIQLQGTEYLAYQEGEENGKLSLNSLKDYLIELVKEYLINNGIIRDDYVQSEPAFKLLATLPELIADRACKDEFGNNINDTYLTRDAVKAYVQSIYEDLFTENPPHIMDGYITVDMLSEAVLQLLNSGGAITNFPDEEDLTVKDGKLKFNDKEYDPNKYSGLGRVMLRRNMVDGVNVLTQKMMSKPNTRYIIQYDFDLRGETINVPDNCILHFVGGSLNNGTINGNDTKILNYFEGDAITSGSISWLGVTADEEDITKVKADSPFLPDVLKFKDKEYDPDNFSGLGRVYLRKNISNGKNILTQDMINKTNTRYIIQYDYDLNGQTINIPENCVLEFEGGSLRNGKITGNTFTIKSSECKIFEQSLEIEGYRNIFYAEWYGISKVDDVSDIISILANLGTKVYFPIGTFEFSKSAKFSIGTAFVGEHVSKTILSYTGNDYALYLERMCSLDTLTIQVRVKKALGAINIDTSTWNYNESIPYWGANTKIQHIYLRSNEPVSLGDTVTAIGINIVIKRAKNSEVTSAISYLPYFNDIYIHIYKTGIRIYNDGENGDVWSNGINMSNLVINADLGFDIGKKDGYRYDSTGQYCFSDILYQSIYNVSGEKGRGINLHGLEAFFMNTSVFDTTDSGSLTGGAILNVYGQTIARGGAANYGFTLDSDSQIYVNSKRGGSGYEIIRHKDWGQSEEGWKDSFAFKDLTDPDIAKYQILRGPYFQDGTRVRHGHIKRINVEDFGNTCFYTDDVNNGHVITRTPHTSTRCEKYVKINNYWRTVYGYYDYSNSHRATYKEKSVYYSFQITQMYQDIYNVRIYIQNFSINNNSYVKLPFSISLAGTPSKDLIFIPLSINCSPLQWIDDNQMRSANCYINSSQKNISNGKYEDFITIQNTTHFSGGFGDAIIDFTFRINKSNENRDITDYEEGTSALDKIPNLDNDFINCKPNDFLFDFESIYESDNIMSFIYDSQNSSILSNGNYFIASDREDIVYFKNKDGEIKDVMGNPGGILYSGDKSVRPANVKIGFKYFDTYLHKPIWWDGAQWVDSEGNNADSGPITSGTFANKPTGVDVGYAYFCTDVQTTEGASNGMMIYYKGSNVWVDALGRVIE